MKYKKHRCHGSGCALDGCRRRSSKSQDLLSSRVEGFSDNQYLIHRTLIFTGKNPYASRSIPEKGSVLLITLNLFLPCHCLWPRSDFIRNRLDGIRYLFINFFFLYNDETPSLIITSIGGPCRQLHRFLETLVRNFLLFPLSVCGSPLYQSLSDR